MSDVSSSSMWMTATLRNASGPCACPEGCSECVYRSPSVFGSTAENYVRLDATANRTDVRFDGTADAIVTDAGVGMTECPAESFVECMACDVANKYYPAVFAGGAPVMLASGVSSFKTDRIPLHVARSVLLAAGIALYCNGLAVAPIAVVTTLNFTIPLFTLVMARVFLRETVDATRWIGTLVGFAGVMVVMQPGGAAFDPRWLTVLLSASAFASLDVLNKVFVGKESFWAMIFYTALFTTLIAAVPAARSWVAVSGAQLGLLAVLGAGANLLLYFLLKSFSLVDASALAPFRYTELMWSAAVGWLFFAEVPAITTLLGAAVIIPSTLYVVWAENRKSKEK